MQNYFSDRNVSETVPDVSNPKHPVKLEFNITPEIEDAVNTANINVDKYVLLPVVSL